MLLEIGLLKKTKQNKTKLQVLPEQANIGSVQRARRREEAQVPAAGVRCRNGFVYAFSVWNQWRNGKRVSAVLKASRRQDTAQKDTEPYHVVITWLRTQISFELLRSVHACVRGSRTPFRSKLEQSLDCKINVASADI